jgi:putative oxidoreductase
MTKLGACFNAVMDRLQWLPGLVSRLTLALLFIPSGWGKLHHLDKVTEYFTSLGIPAAHIQAPFVAGVELVCGVLILLGLFTRIASIPLMGTMVVALVTAKIPDVTDLGDFLSLSEYLFLVLLIWLAVKGPGALSLDIMLCRKHRQIKNSL